MKREINWPYFSRLACPGCTEVRRAGGSEHAEVAEAFVCGFEASAALAVMAGEVHRDGWMALVPGDGWRRLGVDGTWGDHGGKSLALFTSKSAAIDAGRLVPWWPVQPWELEVSDDAVR